MKLPGFTAEASLSDAARYQGRPDAESALGRMAAASGTLAGVHPAIRYACHQVCDGDNFCEVVCGPIDTI